MITKKITVFPSDVRLAASLFPEENQRRARVRFTLEDGTVVVCIVARIDTGQGQFWVSGWYIGEGDSPAGLFEADRVRNEFIFNGRPG